jgi:hypothetical protein
MAGRKKSKKVQKPKLVKKSYTLIADVTIGDKLHKKGGSVRLTKEGLRYFKSINKVEQWQY